MYRSSVSSRVPRRPLALALAAVALGLSATGCIVVQDDGSTAPPVAAPEVPADNPMTVSIDTGAPPLQAPPGEGVGVFVECDAGGHWHVWTTSDSSYSGTSRWFDIVASVVDGSSTIANVAGEDLETSDSVRTIGSDSVELQADTGGATDGVRFDATPGAIVELAVTVDGAADPRIVYWVGGGVIHTGAPTDPVDFQPTEPSQP